MDINRVTKVVKGDLARKVVSVGVVVDDEDATATVGSADTSIIVVGGVGAKEKN